MQSPPFELIDIVVRAGAGAGKTTELTQRVLKLAQDYHARHERYPHFVVTTFTRKATQELKERLLKEALKREDEGLVTFIKRPSHLHISTIHGILSLFLSKFGSIMGLSPKILIAADSKERAQIKRLIRDLCQKNPQFNEDFQQLLENCEFSDLLAAFGKYFRLQQQFGSVPYFRAEDFQQCLEGKSKACLDQFQELAKSIRAADVPEAWQDLAGFCEAIVRSKNLQQAAMDFPSARKTKAVPESISAKRDDLKKSLEFFESWRVTSDFSEVHESLCSIFQRCANPIAEALFEIKKFSGELTMQDLETLSLSLIRQHPEAAESFSKQWDYWLIDEYQDTSPVQVELLKALSGASKSFVVGDPQQSIYLFRGARSEVFSQKEQQVQAQGGVLFSKMTNYRSRPELLEFFNSLFTGLGPQFQKMKPKAEPSKQNMAPVAEVRIIHRDKEASQDQELLASLHRCQELMQAGVPLEKICILARSNQDLDELAWMAQNLGLPVQAVSSGQFFERREVIDALALLKFLCNPHDNRNLLQILRSPMFRVSDQSLYDWCQKAGPSYWQSFSQESDPMIKKLQQSLQSAQEMGVGPVWQILLVQQGYFRWVAALDPSGKREANLWKLIQIIRSEERRPGFSYLSFLKDLDLRSVTTEDSDEGDAVPVIEPQKVHLMTVHASKGLQFPHVILPKMGKTSPNATADFFMFDEFTGRWTLSPVEPEEGKKTASLSGLQLMETFKLRQKEEEDRVLYVALTRAEETVTLIWQEEPKAESWAGRQRLQLTEGLHQEALFSYRVGQGTFLPEKIQVAAASSVKSVGAFQAQEVNGTQPVSVTELLETRAAMSEKNSPVAAQMADIQKALLGVDVHRIFESLKYKWMKDADYDWQTWLPELPVEYQSALRFLAQDQNGLWFQIIQKGEVEYGLAVKTGDNLIQGQIDLWGEDSTGQVWIVDYKTGSPRYQEKAFQQLDIYHWALKKMNKIGKDQKVQLAVIYPFAERTMIREPMDPSKIETQLSSFR